MLHQPGDEVHVTAEPIELRDDYRHLGLAGGLQRGIELWPLLIVILARLNLSERLADLDSAGASSAPSFG